MTKYKDWDLLECLPKGWEIDNTCGSPIHGYDFCTDGKSVLNGGKRALVKTTRKGLPKIEYQRSTKNHKHEKIKNIEPKVNYSFPAKSLNLLARKKFEEQLLKEIMFDMMVCEIEGWDKLEYIKELKKLINGLHLVKGVLKSNALQQTKLEL